MGRRGTLSNEGSMKCWKDWQVLADADAILEPEGEFEQSFGIPYRTLPVECPNLLDIGQATSKRKICKAKLIEFQFVIGCGSQYRRVTHCLVCGFWGCRLLGVVEA